MVRMFFTQDNVQYGLIVSIAIATFLFCDFGVSLYGFICARKETDLLYQSFRASNLVSSLYAIVFTQVVLLFATNTYANFYNGVTEVVFGCICICIGSYTLINCVKTKNM